MSVPGFYPHPVSGIDRRDTHISTVFLTGHWVYKLKKPVDFGFLDFRRLQDRRRFCEREVSLNRRLTRDIYHSVVSIHQTGENAFSLQPGGKIVEYAVRMKQLPEDACLQHRLRKNQVRPSQMKQLGKMLARFYEKTDRARSIDCYGQPTVIAYNMEENFRQLKPYVGDMLDREKWECIRQVSRSFFCDHQALFVRRIAEKRIRDGHGDLRTDHVYFHEGIQIIDCIEFNERFRYGDAALDLSFLHMDLEHMGFSELSRDFLNAYVAASDDLGMYALLDFYASYRAVVMVKIHCLRLQEAEEPEKEKIESEIQHYLNQAYQYAIRFSRPTLWLVCGLPASGKSHLSELLGRALSARVIASDRVRKENRPQEKETSVPFGQGQYRPGMRQYVYAEMFARAHDALKQGRSVILDATFSLRKWRDQARQVAGDLDTNVIVVECICPHDILRARLLQREGTSSASDARLMHFQDMAAAFEPLDEAAPDAHVRVDTAGSMQTAVIKTLSDGYACRCAQIERRLSRMEG